jgi:hypothetical protein
MPVAQRRRDRRIEFAEDALQLRNRHRRVDYLAWYRVDAFGRKRTDQDAAVAIEDAAAPREYLDRVGALRQRFFRIERPFESLNVAEPPGKKERDG